MLTMLTMPTTLVPLACDRSGKRGSATRSV